MKINASIGLPPFAHFPTPQFNKACTDNLVIFLPAEALLTRSAIICTTANAHADVQS